MDHVSRKLNAGDEEIPPLPFEEAVSFMKSRIPVTKAEWNELEAKLRFRAFTVARLAQCDYIEAARQVLYRAIESGKGIAETYKQWQSLQTLVQDDAMKLRPGYWENVFRTNTQTAYTAGKLMQFRDNPPPAWRLLIIDDSRTSDICRGLLQEGRRDIAIASDHPFWKEFGFPSYHYQCRTGLQAVYKSEIEDGAVIENPDMDEMRARFKPMDGFGGNPLEKESWWMMTEGMAKRASRYGIDGDIIKMAKTIEIMSTTMSEEQIAKLNDAGILVTSEKELKQGFKDFKKHVEYMEEPYKNVYSRYAETTELKSDPLRMVYIGYDPEEDILVYNKRFLMSPGRQQHANILFPHELAHRYDFLEIKSWENKEFTDAIEAAIKKVQSNIDRYKNLYNVAGDANPAFQDILSALSDNKIKVKCRHDSTYWAEPNNKALEIFANASYLQANHIKLPEFDGLLDDIMEIAKNMFIKGAKL